MSNHLEIIEQLKNSQDSFAQHLNKVQNLGASVSKTVLRDLIQDARELHESAVVLSYVLFNESETSVQLEIPLVENETPALDVVETNEVAPQQTENNNGASEESSEDYAEETELMNAFDKALEDTRDRMEQTFEVEKELEEVQDIIEEVDNETETSTEAITIEEDLPTPDEVVEVLEGEISNVISMHSTQSAQQNDDDNSLGAKLRKQKIENLNTAIGINDKFLFTNELFNGNTEQFMKTIDQLNNCGSMTSASEIINQLALKNDWEQEGEPFLKLQLLIERKYQ